MKEKIITASAGLLGLGIISAISAALFVTDENFAARLGAVTGILVTGSIGMWAISLVCDKTENGK
jgi:hypothetical protein